MRLAGFKRGWVSVAHDDIAIWPERLSRFCRSNRARIIWVIHDGHRQRCWMAKLRLCTAKRQLEFEFYLQHDCGEQLLQFHPVRPKLHSINDTNGLLPKLLSYNERSACQ